MPQTTLALYCQAMGCQGGTIHQCIAEYPTLTIKQHDNICGLLVDNFNDIEDYEQARWFVVNRKR
jgi:hypothetical protein